MMQPRSLPRPRIGLFAIGLEAYWAQFTGLRELLLSYYAEITTHLEQLGAEVVGAGMVDTAPAAVAAGQFFAQQQVDLLICHTATYATSSQVLPIVQRANTQVLVLNLQPSAQLDYPNTDTAAWLAECSACCVPEISNAFRRANIPFQVVSGTLRDDTRAWQRIADWIRAAGAVAALRNARFGMVGHPYPGMLDMYSDPTMLHAQLGCHVEWLEFDEIAQHASAMASAQIDARVSEIRNVFVEAPIGVDRISRAVTADGLANAARTSLALDTLVDTYQLNAMCYYHRGAPGLPTADVAAHLIVGCTMLTWRGIPCAGEGDLKTAVAMFIMDRIGAGGSFTEFYAMDVPEQFVLMGHDGPAHPAISDQAPLMRALSLYHGKAGEGISIELRVKTGPITILGVTQDGNGHLRMLVAEGESIPGPVLQIGNTNSRLKFASDPATFMDNWCQEAPTHHVALGIGHHANVLSHVARLLGIECVVLR
ncbi:MAG: arabinose isomerase [Roseiflexaceae bacterium]|jgi:L-arabinose isomerase|nr:L-fucose/L-arabinose isomerase family protein [Chloroflexaceae bacterium]